MPGVDESLILAVLIDFTVFEPHPASRLVNKIRDSMHKFMDYRLRQVELYTQVGFHVNLPGVLESIEQEPGYLDSGSIHWVGIASRRTKKSTEARKSRSWLRLAVHLERVAIRGFAKGDNFRKSLKSLPRERMSTLQWHLIVLPERLVRSLMSTKGLEAHER